MAKRNLVQKDWSQAQVATAQCQECDWQARGQNAPAIASNHARDHGHRVGVARTSLGVFSPTALESKAGVGA